MGYTEEVRYQKYKHMKESTDCKDEDNFYFPRDPKLQKKFKERYKKEKEKEKKKRTTKRCGAECKDFEEYGYCDRLVYDPPCWQHRG